MRLWHQSLLPHLPLKQLVGQHRECCALRGKGWYKKHSTVQYALDDKFEKLVAYHLVVINEAEARNINISDEWKDIYYRGKKLNRLAEGELDTGLISNLVSSSKKRKKIYAEHNISYIYECIKNLREKNVHIDFMQSYYGGQYV